MNWKDVDPVSLSMMRGRINDLLRDILDLSVAFDRLIQELEEKENAE